MTTVLFKIEFYISVIGENVKKHKSKLIKG